MLSGKTHTTNKKVSEMSAFALMRGFDVERRGDLEPSIPEQPRPALILHWGSEEV